MFIKSWNKADEQREFISPAGSCNSKRKPFTFITDVISTAINISQRIFYFSSLSFVCQPLISRTWKQLWKWKHVLQLCPTYLPLLQSKLHDYPYWKSSSLQFFLKSQKMKDIFPSIVPWKWPELLSNYCSPVRKWIHNPFFGKADLTFSHQHFHCNNYVFLLTSMASYILRLHF